MSIKYYTSPELKYSYHECEYEMFANSYNAVIEASIDTCESAEKSQESYMPTETSWLSATDHRYFLYIFFFYSRFTKIRIDSVNQFYTLVQPTISMIKNIVQNVDMNTPFYYLFQDKQYNITDGVDESDIVKNVDIFNEVLKKYAEITNNNYEETVKQFKNIYLEIYNRGLYGDDITFQLLYNSVEQELVTHFIFNIFGFDNMGIEPVAVKTDADAVNTATDDITPEMIIEKFNALA